MGATPTERSKTERTQTTRAINQEVDKLTDRQLWWAENVCNSFYTQPMWPKMSSTPRALHTRTLLPHLLPHDCEISPLNCLVKTILLFLTRTKGSAIALFIWNESLLRILFLLPSTSVSVNSRLSRVSLSAIYDTIRGRCSEM